MSINDGVTAQLLHPLTSVVTCAARQRSTYRSANSRYLVS